MADDCPPEEAPPEQEPAAPPAEPSESPAAADSADSAEPAESAAPAEGADAAADPAAAPVDAPPEAGPQPDAPETESKEEDVVADLPPHDEDPADDDQRRSERLSTDSTASAAFNESAAAALRDSFSLAAEPMPEETDPHWRVHHDAWVSERLSTPLVIQVSDPQSEGRIKKFTTYLVRTEPLGQMVRRRFSDFVWLAGALQARYVGLLIPPLPKKTLVGNKKEAFVQARMRLLGLFMDALARSPFLLDDSSFRAFLAVQDQREWDTAKRVTVSPEAHMQEGESRWRAALTHYELPGNFERAINDVKRQLEPLERQLGQLAQATRRVAEASRTYAAEVGQYKDAFAEWHQLEAVNGDPTRVEYANKEFDAMDRTMAQGETVIAGWASVLDFQPSINELLLHDVITFEHMQVQALREMLRQRDAMITAQTKAATALRKREAELATARKKNKNTARLEKLVAEDRQNVERCESVVLGMTKGACFSELDAFNSRRERNLHETMGMLASAHFQYARRLGGVWQNFLATLEGDSERWTERVKTVLNVAASGDGVEAGAE